MQAGKNEIAESDLIGGPMPAFLDVVIGGIALALLGFPFFVATKFPERFPAVDKVVGWGSAIVVLMYFAFSAGYRLAVMHQEDGSTISDDAMTVSIWVLVGAYALVLVYLLVLRLAVAEWAKAKKDKDG